MDKAMWMSGKHRIRWIGASATVAEARLTMARERVAWLGVHRGGVIVGTVDEVQLRLARAEAKIADLTEGACGHVRWAA